MKLLLLLLVCAATVDAGWIFRSEPSADEMAFNQAEGFFIHFFTEKGERIPRIVGSEFKYFDCEGYQKTADQFLLEGRQFDFQPGLYSRKMDVTNAKYLENGKFLTYDVQWLFNNISHLRFRMTTELGALPLYQGYAVVKIEDIACGAGAKAEEIAGDFFRRYYTGNGTGVLELLPEGQDFKYTTCRGQQVSTALAMLKALEYSLQAPLTLRNLNGFIPFTMNTTNAQLTNYKSLAFDAEVLMDGFPYLKLRFTATHQAKDRSSPLAITEIEDITCKRRRFRYFW